MALWPALWVAVFLFDLEACSARTAVVSTIIFAVFSPVLARFATL